MIGDKHWTMWLCYAVMIWLAYVGRRDTLALSLLGAWAVAEVFVRLSGIALPLGLYFFLDAAVICIVMADDRLLTRLVVCLYPFAWAAYTLIEHATAQWYVLWAISLAQFILAGLQCRLGVSGHGMGRLGATGRPLGGGGAYPMALHLSSAEADQHAAGDGEHRAAEAVERTA